jgi:hypothetical protein
VRPLGIALTTLPVGPPHHGSTAGFTFEMHYIMTNAVPARRAAWILLHERVQLLATSCAEIAAQDATLPAVREAGEKAAEIAAALSSHR